MGLFGFLKKKPKKEEKIQTKLKFEETGSFILDKEKSIKDKEKEAFEIVQEKIKESTHQIKEKIQILEKVDVNAKKANDRAKNIVKDSLKAYVELVEGFMYKLKDLEYSDFEQVTNKIGKLFLDFNKSSLLSYEKATYLVGKEMVAVRDNIKLFSKELLKIFDENKTLLDSFKIIKKIKVKQSQLTIQDKAIKENKELVKALDEKIKQVKEKHKKALEDLEKFKQTKDYREIQEKKEKIKESE